MILVKGVPMRVIGMLASKGQTGFGQDQDDLVMIPFSTAERKVLGVARAADLAKSGERQTTRPRQTPSASARA